MGRDGALGRPGGLAQSLSGTVGSVLNPCSALRMEFQLLPGEKTSICFYIGLCEPEREADWLNRHQGAGAALRARQLAQTQAVAALEHTGIGDALHHTLQRATAFLVDWRLSGAGKRLEPTPVRDLWALGVSGDLPILAVHISEKAQLDLAREAVRAHEFYHAMGLWADLLLINEYGNDYEQPVRDALGEIVSASTLREWQGKPGGVYLRKARNWMAARASGFPPLRRWNLQAAKAPWPGRCARTGSACGSRQSCAAFQPRRTAMCRPCWRAGQFQRLWRIRAGRLLRGCVPWRGHARALGQYPGQSAFWRAGHGARRRLHLVQKQPLWPPHAL